MESVANLFIHLTAFLHVNWLYLTSHFFCQWALTLPPGRFCREVTSALRLTSLGAPPDCRNDWTRLGEGFARLVLPEDITSCYGPVDQRELLIVQWLSHV